MLSSLTNFAAACETKGIGILPSWYKYLKSEEDTTGRCSVVFVFPDDIGTVLLAIVEILLRLGVYVAIGFVIYGGILYMTSQGEPDKAANAQKTLLNAVIGLVITIVATGVVAFIGGRLLA